MTRFEKWLMGRIIRKEVGSEVGRNSRVSALYYLIRSECEAAYTEDNAPTISDYLSERFEQTQKWPFGRPIAAQGGAKP